jgi:hypothetical protein
MSVEKRVRAYLELASKDAEAAELLLAGGNRYAAYHVQQAVEKVTKALLLARGMEAGIEHRLEELFKSFPADDSWPARLHQFAAIPRTRRHSGIRHQAVVSPLTHQWRGFGATSRRFATSSRRSAKIFSVPPPIAERSASGRPVV